MEKKVTRCSFCGKEVEEVDQIVSGINANICNECIEICHSMLEYQERTKKKESLEKLPTPVEIKKILDEYIIQQDNAKKVDVVMLHIILVRRSVRFIDRNCRSTFRQELHAVDRKSVV